MSFMRRYWQGELVKTRSWTTELTFVMPLRISAFAQTLPAGHYKVEYTEVEVAAKDRTVRQVTRCLLPVPPSLMPPGVRPMFVNVDHTELERRHTEQTTPACSDDGLQPGQAKPRYFAAGNGLGSARPPAIPVP